MEAKKGLKLMARRAGAQDEQHYDQGVVTKVAKNGVFYTGYTGDSKTVKKWVPANYGQYKVTLSYGNSRLPSVNFVDLVFSK